MKRYKTKGRHIRELREGREHRATQKEFAYEVQISERHLRQIETRNAAVSLDVVKRMACALGVQWQAIVFAADGPSLVLGSDARPPEPTTSEELEPVTMPRFETFSATVVRDEADLIESVIRRDVVVSHILTKLTAETNGYADELLALLESLAGERRDSFRSGAGRDELRIRARLRELLVLLKGNDVWVYATDHIKYLPESHEVQPKRDASTIQMQTVVAFGPPGDYGEETLCVPVDHGQPWIYDPKTSLMP